MKPDYAAWAAGSAHHIGPAGAAHPIPVIPTISKLVRMSEGWRRDGGETDPLEAR